MSNLLIPRNSKKHCLYLRLNFRDTKERTGDSRHLPTHLSGMQERSSVPLVAWPRSMHSHLNKTARENWNARGTLFLKEVLRTSTARRVLVPLGPRFRKGRLLSGRRTGHRVWHHRRVAWFGHFQVNSRTRCQIRTIPYSTARRDATRRPLTSSARRAFESGPLFRNVQVRQARDTGDALTSHQMAVSSRCASVRHLAGVDSNGNVPRTDPDRIGRAAMNLARSTDVPTYRAITD